MKDTSCGSGCSTCSPARTAGLASDFSGSRKAGSKAAASTQPLHPAPRVVLIAVAALLFTLGLLLRYRFQALPQLFPEHALFFLAYGLAGGKIVWKALHNLVRGRVLDEYFLMTVASLGAAAIGELPEAVAVMLFFSVGELLEDAAVNRSRRSIAALMEFRPDYANLVSAAGTEQKIDPEAVRAGQLILVKPGEKIPLDGTVERGDSFVDNAALTGESVPHRVEAGDRVLAGAVNGPGLLRVTVTRDFSESSLVRIFKLVEDAAVRKAKTEQFITRFARCYTPAVVLGAMAMAVVPPLLLPGAEFSDWLYRALVLLVISCPCALVISIPLGYFGGIGSASRHGILVKGGNFLEALLKVKTVVFDKTGTLTRGVFRVAEVLPRPGFDGESLLKWAARAELYAGHPVARAIREAYPGELSLAGVDSYTELRGLGVKALVEGNEILAGSGRLLEREGVAYTPCAAAGIIVYVAVGGRFAGCLAVRDEIKEDAAAAVRRLKELGVEQTVMLTGDSEAAAAEAASQAGIDSYHAGLLPEEKVARLEALLAKTKAPDRFGRGAAPGKLAFVGDGINDAPALARADVGIAMGGLGTDAAIEAADVVVMDDRLSRLPKAMEIAAFTRKIVVQNIVLALGVKGFFVVLGAAGAATIWGAVFADVGVALLAIANAARVLRFK